MAHFFHIPERVLGIIVTLLGQASLVHWVLALTAARWRNECCVSSFNLCIKYESPNIHSIDCKSYSLEGTSGIGGLPRKISRGKRPAVRLIN